LVVEPINGRDKVVEGLMRGKSAVGEMILGGRKIREKEGLGKGIFGFWVIFLVYGREKNWERKKEEGMNQFMAVTVLLEDSHRGTVVAGNFGLGGQEIIRNPGAREPERLFLVGWEVNQFGQDSSALVQHHVEL
jgi:hypothetical protein